jgi:cytidylate kinase
MIIVIDGPAGAGKSSTAKAVAQRVGLHFLDTGAFYRMAALLYMREACDLSRLLKRLERAALMAQIQGDQLHFTIDGEDVTTLIRSVEVSAHVSQVAANPQVRDQVNQRLRPIAQLGDFIAEGRDLGTVVFPEAELKFWMTADLEERARRRAAEMGEGSDLETIRANILERDRIDSQRETAPLVRAQDAIDIDTSTMNFEEQVEFILSHYRKLQLKLKP